MPTGIVTAELVDMPRGGGVTGRACGSCEHVELDEEAGFRKWCGATLS